MKIVIIGQKWLAASVLKSVLSAGLEVVAAAPEHPNDRLTLEAERAGLPTVNLEDIPRCGLILSAHCHRFITADVRMRADFGVLAYHPSLLPRHRGRDAIHWTLAMGDPVAGGTAYWMDDGADTGPVQVQDWCFVRPDDTPAALWRRDLGPMGVRLLTEAAQSLAAGNQPVRMPQDEVLATFEPALTHGPAVRRLRRKSPDRKRGRG